MYKIVVFLLLLIIIMFIITFNISKSINVLEDESNIINFYVEYNSISKILKYVDSQELNVIILNGYKIYKSNGIIQIERLLE